MSYTKAKRPSLPAYQHLQAAECSLVKAFSADREVEDGQLELSGGHLLRFDDIQAWLRAASKHFEEKALASAFVPHFREDPTHRDRRTNGQFRSSKGG